LKYVDLTHVEKMFSSLGPAETQ